jgi:hypothetical protein
MKKLLMCLGTVVLLSVSLCGCAPAATGAADVAGEPPVVAPAGTVAAVSTASEPNFLLLISDEANDIEDFSSLWITVSGVGLILGDEEGIVEEMFEPVEVNLVGLTGEAAVALWGGYLPEGDYTKIFIYVDQVIGLLESSEEEIEIKLPSNKLHLDLPVLVEGAETTEFVFDITVLRAGNSGQYLLKPQASESGQGAAYKLMEQTLERIRVRASSPEGAGKPDWAATGAPGETGAPARGEKPTWTSDVPEEEQGEDEPGRPEHASQPEGAGKPA